MIPNEKHPKVMGGRDVLSRLRLSLSELFSIYARGKVEQDVSWEGLV